MNIIHSVPRIPGTLSPDVRRKEGEADHLLPCSVGGILRGSVPPLPPYTCVAWRFINNGDDDNICYLLTLSAISISDD
jgi:hypothetical protein